MVPSIGFQTFFVPSLKIDSWKFTMLLLYILWDDWPIFMISGLNEQQQQQLEYILLKPDFHSWWISKMQSDILEEQYVIKFCFKLGKNATETYGMLQTAFWPSCMNWASCFEWHKRFKESMESVRDDERCGKSKEVNTPELIDQRVRVTIVIYSHNKYAYIHIYMFMQDTYWCNKLIRRSNKRHRKTSLTKYLPLTLLQGFKKVVWGFTVRGSWRSNITAIFWPLTLMAVTLCLSCSLDAQPEA